MTKRKISFVSPCYNEEGNVEKFYELVRKRMENTNFRYEIIFVNDGSGDKTYKKLEELFHNDMKHIKVVNFLHNFGKEAAILAGLKETTGDYICTIDSDLQQDPKYTLRMADILENHPEVDMVAAQPSNEKDSKVLSFYKKSFYSIINKMSNVPFTQGVSDFRTFRKNIKYAIIALPEHNRFSKGIFSWVCPNPALIEYEVAQRESGETKWSFTKLFKYAIEGITSFSNMPLTFPIIFGCVELLVCLIMFIVQLVQLSNPLIYPLVRSIRWLTMLVLLLTGIQSINTGIVAKYIAKINTETANRPMYIVKNILKVEDLIWEDK